MCYLDSRMRSGEAAQETAPNGSLEICSTIPWTLTGESSMETLLLGILILLVIVLLAVLVLLFRSTRLQNLAGAVQQVQTQGAVLAEKLAQVERNQNQVSQSILALGTGLAETGAVAKNLAQTTTAIQTDLSQAKEGLAGLQTHARARQELEQQTAESIRRLEAIIAGTQTKGTAGENILEAVFAKLPPEWQVRNFRVGDKAVEFGLRLPNNLVLPIDSKWTATHLLEQFMACDDPAEQQKLKAQIEAAVLGRAKEVRKYIDPNVTVNFGIAAVPDAIYDLCPGVQADVCQMNVVLVSYSMFVPYLLLVFQTILKTSQSIDLHRLDSYLRGAQDSIEALQQELEGRFSRAIKMLNNSRNDMSVHLSKINSGLTSLQISASTPPAVAELGEPTSTGEV